MKLLYLNIFQRMNIDVMHIQHLLGHSFDLPRLADMLGIPTTLFFHDFYFCCPSIHLLDSEGQYCGARCYLQEAQCHFSNKWLGDSPPH
jgi:hypothetical protein